MAGLEPARLDPAEEFFEPSFAADYDSMMILLPTLMLQLLLHKTSRGISSPVPLCCMNSAVIRTPFFCNVGKDSGIQVQVV